VAVQTIYDASRWSSAQKKTAFVPTAHSTCQHTCAPVPSGKLLVRFYGEHSSSWAAPKQLTRWQQGQEEAEKLEALRLWGKRANK
jgi:hypothetical protein